MKLVDKVVLFVFGTILLAYVIYLSRSKSAIFISTREKSSKRPSLLLKDKLVYKPLGKPQDFVLNNVVNAVRPRPVQSRMSVHQPLAPPVKKEAKKAKVALQIQKPPTQESFLNDPLLLDGMRLFLLNTNMLVNIVEENEKALIYWFSLAKVGFVKKEGNTLVLFSNSLELTLPPYYQHFPFHRIPAHEHEMLYLLQSKGSYVLKAILTGMFKRIIWIRPSWTGISGTYQKETMEFGMFETNDQILYCLCKANKCGTRDSKINLLQSDCKSRVNVVVENVKDLVLGQYLVTKSWLPRDNVILHVDASYFGYISPLAALQRAIPDEKGKVLLKIDNITKKVLCPKSIPDEIYLDRLLLKAIEYSKTEKLCRRNQTSKIKTGPFAECKGEIKSKNFKMDNEIYKFLRRKLETSTYLCDKYTSFVDFLLKELSSILNNRKEPQLATLKLYGFCLTTTVKAGGKFGICKGSKSFGEEHKFVRSHQTSSKEIKNKIEILNQLIKKLSTKDLKTITYCRSVRHGYAPRFHASRIENKLLELLHSFNPRLILNYDRHILGHKYGWYNRSYLTDTL